MKNIHSLKFYLVAIFLPSVIISAIVFYNYHYTNNKREQVETFNSTIVDVLEITSFLSKIEGMLETVAKSLERNNYSAKYLEENVRRAKEFDEIEIEIEMFVVSREGNIVQSSNNAKKVKKIKDLESFKELLNNNSKVYICKRGDVNTNLKYENVITMPIVGEDNEISHILIIGLDLENIVTNKLKMNINSENFLLLSEGIEVLGNSDLLNNHGNSITYKMNEWSIIYRINKTSLSTTIFFILASLTIGFGIPHMFYSLLLIFSIKQKEKMREIKMLEQFAASTAHEIKNPLTSLKGFVQILQVRNHDEEDQLAFSIINEEIEHINSLATGFLVLGKPIVVGDTTFHLQKHVFNITALLSKEAEAKGVTFVQNIEENDIYLQGDSKHIKQVLLNIGKNAIEASESGSCVIFNVISLNNEIKIEFIDRGVGIKNEDLEKIFTPFHTTKTTGNGLGLVICKKIIESYQGTIQINSKYHYGTTVQIMLPKI